MSMVLQLLCSELLDRVTRTRGQLQEAAAVAAMREEQMRAAQDSDSASLRRAQDTARDILNISQSDLDDIMSADGDHVAQVSGCFVCPCISFSFFVSVYLCKSLPPRWPSG